VVRFHGHARRRCWAQRGLQNRACGVRYLDAVRPSSPTGRGVWFRTRRFSVRIRGGVRAGAFGLLPTWATSLMVEHLLCTQEVGVRLPGCPRSVGLTAGYQALNLEVAVRSRYGVPDPACGTVRARGTRITVRTPSSLTGCGGLATNQLQGVRLLTGARQDNASWSRGQLNISAWCNGSIRVSYARGPGSSPGADTEGRRVNRTARLDRVTATAPLPDSQVLEAAHRALTPGVRVRVPGGSRRHGVVVAHHPVKVKVTGS
jgi:hypothetical protein